jgi:hypothetical protein
MKKWGRKGAKCKPWVQRVDQHVGILTTKCQRLVHGVTNQEKQSDHIYIYISVHSKQMDSNPGFLLNYLDPCIPWYPPISFLQPKIPNLSLTERCIHWKSAPSYHVAHDRKSVRLRSNTTQCEQFISLILGWLVNNITHYLAYQYKSKAAHMFKERREADHTRP